ncbi:MAG: SAM hydrolase/SAM-dependent halogenase family protein, partial [Vicinamibacteraceae bacterium]
GVLSAAFAELAPKLIVELTEQRYFRPAVSRTFEGRDRFAPAAAWLARGTAVEALGPPISDAVRLALPKPRVGEDEIVGAVVRVDRFGNLITNVAQGSLERLAARGAVVVRVADRSVSRLVGMYSDIGDGEICGLIGSAGTLEIAARSASAAAITGCGRLAPVIVRLLTPDP